ncbi:hypothetical protein COU58_04200 [Candidatus Pacearchaeota archaeon CG10_big_fil_rev_8_21_14_0_10_32_42]|nr:MAG: hypothetical protein COU58_04200 [Candidatus Pacearchaeota archaeon CG10_big_fil_rev_8_21_14_0_10_32_42]
MKEEFKKINLKIPLRDYKDLEALNLKFDKPTKKHLHKLIIQSLQTFLDEKTKLYNILRGTGQDDPEYLKKILEEVAKGGRFYG